VMEMQTPDRRRGSGRSRGLPVEETSESTSARNRGFLETKL
jgi:hypothetical protein